MLLSSQLEISKQDHDLDEPVPNPPTPRHNSNLRQCNLHRRTAEVVSSEAASKLRANSTSLLLRKVSVFLHLPSVPDRTPRRSHRKMSQKAMGVSRATIGLQRDNLEALQPFNRAILPSRPPMLSGKASQTTNLVRRNSHQEQACFLSEPLNRRVLLGSTSTPVLPPLPRLQTTHFPSSQPHNLRQPLLPPASDQVPSISISSHLNPQGHSA
jgi:hypothetical protein